jgi:hypothetical protein
MELHMSELRYCLACKKQTKFDFLRSDWYCDICGRNEIVSKNFIESQTGYTQNLDGTKNNSISNSIVELGIKLSLLIALFPFSVIYLILAHGMDEAVNIVKNLILDAIKSAISLIFIALFIIIIINIFKK